jgi:flagellum-specific peptidoglycan hydrolase FlgJ
MKILRITESQYKRLVRSKNLLNEQFKRIVYLDDKDKHDVNPDMITILDYINYKFDSLYRKPLYVLKIEDGKVYVDTSKYTDEEIEYVKNQADLLMKSTKYSKDKLIDDEDFAFDSGVDSDYDWGDEDITVVEPDDDTAEIEDNDDTAEIEDNDDTTEEIEDDDDVAEIEDDDDTAEIEDGDVDLDYDTNKTYTRTEYINLVKDIAINQMERHKIPASITIAQGILESGNGNSLLAREGKNHFGVKCHSWSGEKIYLNTEEEDANGNRYTVEGDCFRKYDKIKDSFEDHSKFLKNNSRYNSLFDLDITDYKGWSNGLQNAGYATSSRYAKTLINIIEKNNLQKYDKGGDTITDCESCLTKIETKTYNENVNDENVKDFRWWINQDSNILKSVTDKLKECCETKSDPTISTSYNRKNEHTLIAFSVVGNEWINSGKPSKPVGVGGISFSSRSQLDVNLNRVSQKLIDDIETAAKNVGVVVEITYARKDHKVGAKRKDGTSYRSRHCFGVGVDISRVEDDNGVLRDWGNESQARRIGIYDKIISFTDELENMGYYMNSESGHNKAILSFGFDGHNNHVHVSNKNIYGDFKETYKKLKKWCNSKPISYTIKGDEVFDNTNSNVNTNTIEENSNLPRKFDKVPVGTNVYRSNQPSLSQLKYILNNYDIDTVVRMNGEEGTGVTPEDEKELVESMGKNYVFQNAHINEGGGSGHRGYETGKGYVGSLNAVQPILKQGNVLIHCSGGADRTGYQVARFMKDNGYCGNPDSVDCRKTLWNYTTKYNNWKRFIPEGRVGYIRYMEAFYPHDKWKKEIGE